MIKQKELITLRWTERRKKVTKIDDLELELCALDECIEYTEEQQNGTQKLIPVVAEAVIKEMYRSRRKLHKEITVLRGMSIKGWADECYTQMVAPYYWGCSIDPKEIPF